MDRWRILVYIWNIINTLWFLSKLDQNDTGNYNATLPTKGHPRKVFANWPIAFEWQNKNAHKFIASVARSLLNRCIICGKLFVKIGGFHSLIWTESWRLVLVGVVAGNMLNKTKIITFNGILKINFSWDFSFPQRHHCTTLVKCGVSSPLYTQHGWPRKSMTLWWTDVKSIDLSYSINNRCIPLSVAFIITFILLIFEAKRSLLLPLNSFKIHFTFILAIRSHIRR